MRTSPRFPWLIAALVLTSAMLVGHLVALESFFYWKFWWYDIAMHALGGVALAALTLGVIGRHAAVFWGAMAIMLFGWELFEYIGGISTGQPNFWLDTVIDIIVGSCAALIVYRIAKPSFSHE